MQLAIITKYNLASCYQTLGENERCIKYLSQAARLLNLYSNMDSYADQKSLFKVGSQRKLEAKSRLGKIDHEDDDYMRKGRKTPK